MLLSEVLITGLLILLPTFLAQRGGIGAIKYIEVFSMITSIIVALLTPMLFPVLLLLPCIICALCMALVSKYCGKSGEIGSDRAQPSYSPALRPSNSQASKTQIQIENPTDPNQHQFDSHQCAGGGRNVEGDQTPPSIEGTSEMGAENLLERPKTKYTEEQVRDCIAYTVKKYYEENPRYDFTPSHSARGGSNSEVN